MDPKLQKAAATGDIGILKQFLKDCEGKGDYSVILSPCEENSEETGTILHVAAWNGKAEFLKEAITELSKHGHAEDLICYREQYGSNLDYNLLHVAAKLGSLEMVQAITGYYKRRINNNKQLASKPWLKKDIQGSTPLHIALKHPNQDCAMEILSLDLVSHCNSVDNFDNSPLFLAVKYGHDEVAKKILNDAPRCSTTGQDDFTPLHFAPNCSVEVCKLLLLKKVKPHSNASSITQQPILHNWIELEKESMLFKQLLDENCTDEKITRYLVNLISECDKVNNNNGFHILAEGQKKKSSKIIADFYNKYEGEDKKKDLPPWLKENKSHKTPLHVALEHDSKDASDWLMETYKDATFKPTEDGPLVCAVKKTRHDHAMRIGQTLAQYGWSPFCPDGKKIWHVQGDDPNNVEVSKWLVQKLPNLVPMKEAREALEYASNQGYKWLVESVLKQHPFALKDCPLVWKEACKNGHYDTIVAFIENCPYFRDLCIEVRTTPLHHVKFIGYEHYRKFLDYPVIKGLINCQDEHKESPLHRAVNSRNIELAEALLNMKDVNLDLKDKHKRTPLNLLHQAPPNKWDDMCDRYGIIRGFQIHFFRNSEIAHEFRNTLSVVAALLATITFTAGFTVPGGFNQDNGDALLGGNAAFIVFIISDAFALFCSLVMLVLLMLSVISDHATSLMLIAKSMTMLLVALVSTVMAFMTGVYVVLRNKCLWVAIVIIVMCSILILGVATSLVYGRCKFYSPRHSKKDVEQGLGTCNEEDNATNRGHEDNNLWVYEIIFRCFGGGRQSQQEKSE